MIANGHKELLSFITSQQTTGVVDFHFSFKEKRYECVVTVDNGKMSCLFEETNKNVAYWKPETNMREPETIHTNPPLHLDIGQIVGVVIIEQFRLYIKIFFGQDGKLGKYCGAWDETSDPEELEIMEETIVGDIENGIEIYRIRGMSTETFMSPKFISAK